jgi:hypothetical protein
MIAEAEIRRFAARWQVDPSVAASSRALIQRKPGGFDGRNRYRASFPGVSRSFAL